jgi:hypothetical protein
VAPRTDHTLTNYPMRIADMQVVADTYIPFCDEI